MSTGEERAVRVMFVTPYADIGGAEAFLESILESVGSEWVHQVVVLEDGEFVERLRERGFAVRVIDSPQRRIGIVKGASALRRELRRDPPQVIHAHQVKAALVGAIASAGIGIPVLWNKVDSALDGPVAWTIGRGCARVIGISQSSVSTFRGRTRRKVRVVHPGLPKYRIDRAEARRIVRDVLELDEGGRAIVLSGRLCPPKGQLDLIEIAPAILEAHPGTKLAFLGADSRGYEGYGETLRRRAEELGVAGSVLFLGYRSEAITSVADAVRFVAGCDLLVAPSRKEEKSGWEEGFGLAVVEAMSVGTPVVAYRNGSLPEVLGDCGWIVPEGDRSALSDAILAVLSDPTRSAEMADCGAARSGRYTLEETIAGMRDVYREAAG